MSCREKPVSCTLILSERVGHGSPWEWESQRPSVSARRGAKNLYDE